MGPPPSATIANTQAILHRASATVPYHDLLEYKLYIQLTEPQLSTVVDMVNVILNNVPSPLALCQLN